MDPPKNEQILTKDHFPIQDFHKKFKMFFFQGMKVEPPVVFLWLVDPMMVICGESFVAKRTLIQHTEGVFESVWIWEDWSLGTSLNCGDIG